MGLFGGSKKQSYLGVDLGSGGIKVVELLNEKGRSRLMTYGYSEWKPEDAVMSPFDDLKETARILSRIHKDSGMQSKQVVAALPIPDVFSSVISVPKFENEAETKKAINTQIKKLAPMPPEEMIIYSTSIDRKKKGSKDDKKKKKEDEKYGKAGSSSAGKEDVPMRGYSVEAKAKNYERILVTGAAKTLVQKYVEIFKYAKLELKALDIEAYGLIRSLVGKDKNSVLILDIGNKRTSITVVEDGVPFYTRSVNIGGETVTKSIMQQLNLPQADAEQMKTDLMNIPIGDQAAVPNYLEALIQTLINEIRYSLEWYGRMDLSKAGVVEKVVLTGGSAHLPYVTQSLTKALDINVYIGDPWARVIYPESLRPVLDDVGARLAVSVGLAMHEIEK